jgi:hypothetical protein
MNTSKVLKPKVAKLILFQVFLILLSSINIHAQTNLTCELEEGIQSQLLTLGNNSECADWHNYIPDEHTQIVYIKVNFHFIAKEDPFYPMNFTATWDGVDADNNYTGYDFANGVIQTVNSRLATNTQMNLLPGNSTEVIDRKYRLILSGVHFWESNQYWGSYNLANLMNNFGVNPGEEINIFFQSHELNGNGITGGAANTAGNRRCLIKGCWNSYAEFNDPSYWLSAYEVMHETGHNFTLLHTMRLSGGTCNQNWDDGFTDTPTQGQVLAMGLPDPCCPSAYTSSTCSNNMMDYSTEDAITPQQLAKIHYSFTHDMLKYIDKEYCEKNSAFNETIQGNENLVWNNVRIFRGDLILEPGANLTIRCDVYMPHNAKIIVKTGAKLTIDGGRVTHLCDQLWSGIEVWGNSSADQLPETNQGQIIIKNSGTIEWAENGIQTIRVLDDGSYDWSKTGGIIKCTDANFLNNRRSVSFMSYHNFNSIGQIANRSYFRNSHFEITDVSRFNSQAHNCFISMWDVNGVKILGCDFKNTAPNISLQQRGNGIFTILSTYKVGDYCSSSIPSSGNCPQEDLIRSKFENLNYAIRSAGLMKSLLLSIEHAQFTNNRGGVFLSGFGQSQVIENDFDWTEIVELNQEQTFGIYLQECNGYEIEENFFDAHDGEETYGIAINNSGEYSNLIYRNIFQRCKVASMIYGLNRILDGGFDDHPGLELSCNIYGENGTDSKMNEYAIGLWKNASISSYQGVLSEAGAAGNLFYPECDPDNGIALSERELKLMEQDSPSYFDYIHTPNDATEPTCRTYGIGLLNNQNDQWLYGQLEYCVKNISTDILPSIHGSTLVNTQSIYSGLKTTYDGYVNNGSGQQLLALVKDPSKTSIEVRNALLDAAPTVADELLITALNRTPSMDGWHMAQALLANSPLKAAVLSELEKTNYLDFYKELVNNNQPNGLTTRTLMAMDATHYRNERDNAKNDLLRSYAGDNENLTNWSAIIQATNDFSYTIEPWEKASIYLEKGDLIMANSVLNNSSSDDDRCEMLKIFLGIQQNGLEANGLSLIQKTNLETIAADPENSMNATANIILEYWGGGDYKEFLALPEGRETKAKHSKENNEISDIKIISIYPNPSNENTRITCFLPKNAENSLLTIYNPQGQIIQILNAEQSNGALELTTKDWTAGIYYAELTADGIKLSSESFLIIH